MNRWQVSSAEDAVKALEYYNGFHDGFMKRIVIESRDEIETDLGQTCTGLFDVQIDFAHYNYQAESEPFHPYNQIVHAEFSEVQDIFCDFQQGFLGNTIISLTIVPVGRRLSLRLGRHFYMEEYRRHEFRESQLFTFATARFTEQPAC